jgi:hypothetical protein
MNAHVRTLSVVVAAALCGCPLTAVAGVPLCVPDDLTLSVANLPVLPFGGEYLLAFPRAGTISSATITLDFTTSGTFQAENLVFELGGPTGGILLIGGTDLGWSGQGTFHAVVNTSNFNGSLQAEGPVSFWFMNISPTADSLPTPVQGSWNEGSLISFAYDPRPYWCDADINADGDATVQDIFDLLTCFNEGRADYNRSGTTTVQDIFDFLSAWSNGCPCGPGEC